MEITFRIEILILIGIVAAILWGHVICSCSKVNIGTLLGEVSKKLTPNQHQYELVMSNPAVEGFTGANINNGQSAQYNVSYDKPVDTSSWFSPNLTFGPGQKPGKDVQNILNRQPQPVPLPEGELLLFANTPFKPECCANGGSSYSNGSGCACITMPQYNYLIERGSNNIPYSEY
jgi:hypothetical protein